MGDLVLKGATSGQITLTPTAIAGTNTLTVPAKTGNLITSADSGTVTGTMIASSTISQSNLGTGVVGNGPSFSVYQTGAQTIGASWTKVQFNTEEWDTANCFDSTTNYRFTPNVAGYYQINCFIKPNNNYNQYTGLYKNGSLYRYVVGSSTMFGLPLSTLVYCNGSTDYIEIWYYSSTSINTDPSSQQVWWNGFLARSA